MHEFDCITNILIKFTNVCFHEHFCFSICKLSMDVGPCHHGMARPRVADGGMASYMEGSCE